MKNQLNKISIENLKCCGNCEHFDDWSDQTCHLATYETNNNVSSWSICNGDNWSFDNMNKNLRTEEKVDIQKNSTHKINVNRVKQIKSKTSLIDIKQLNIPNICFSLTENDDNREVEYSKQRKMRGFDDSETWSLTDTIVNFSLPRLERYLEITKTMNDSDEYINELESVVKSFKLIIRDRGARNFNNTEQQTVDKGLDLFRELFMGLWW